MTDTPTKRRLLLLICCFVVGSTCFSQPPAHSPEFPQLVLQSGHANAVLKMVFSSDGSLLATAGADNRVIIWDARSGTELRVVSGTLTVSLAFNSGHTLLATGEIGGKVLLWDVQNGSEVKELRGQTGVVTSLAFSSDGEYFASSDEHGLVLLWDKTFSKPLKSLDSGSQGFTAVAFSPNNNLLTSAGSDGVIHLWSVASGQVVGALHGNKYPVQTLTFSPDGNLLASGGGDFRKTGELSLWNTSQRQQLHTVVDGNGPVTDVAFTGEKEIVSLSPGQEPKFRASDSWAEIKKPFPVYLGYTNCMSFDPGDRVLALGGQGTISLADLASAQWVRTLPVSLVKTGAIAEIPESPLASGVDVAFSRDRRWLLTGTTNGVGIWDLTTGAQVEQFSGGLTTNLAVDNDTGRIAFGNYKGNLEIWSLTDFSRVKHFSAGTSAISAVAFSGSGGLFGATNDKGEISLWNVHTGAVLKSWSVGSAGAGSIAFQPHGNDIVYESADGSLMLWRVATGTLLRSYKETQCGPTQPRVVWSNDGAIVASTCGRAVLLWRAHDFANIATLDNHGDGLTSLAFSADGTTLATSAMDGAVVLWNIPQRSVSHAYIGSPTADAGIALSPDGAWIAAAGRDGSTLLWNTQEESPVCTLLSIARSRDWLVTSKTGLFDGSEGAWGIGMWRYSPNLQDVAPLEALFDRFFLPGLLSEVILQHRLPATTKLEDPTNDQPSLSLWIAPENLAQNTPAPIRQTLQRLQAGGGPSGRIPIDRRTVDVQVEISGTPDSLVRGVRLFENGLLIKRWLGDLALDRSGHTALSTPVTLPAGDSTLLAYGFNRHDVKGLDATLNVSGSDKLAHSGTVYIVVVGIDSYSDADFQLRYAVADARVFASELGASAKLWPRFARVQVVSLVNEEATKANVLAAMNRLSGDEKSLSQGSLAQLLLLQKVVPEDVVFIYFAGHGYSDGEHFYMIPYDLGYEGKRANVGLSDLVQIEEHSVSDSDLEAALERINARELVLVLDACNSGQVLEAKEPRMGPMNSPGLAHLAYEKGMYLLAGAESYQAAVESSKYGHGLLTYALVEEGLKQSKAADGLGRITLRSWLDFAAAEVPQLQTDTNRPILGGRGFKGSQEVKIVQSPRVFHRREIDSSQLLIKDRR